MDSFLTMIVHCTQCLQFPVKPNMCSSLEVENDPSDHAVIGIICSKSDALAQVTLFYLLASVLILLYPLPNDLELDYDQCQVPIPIPSPNPASFTSSTTFTAPLTKNMGGDAVIVSDIMARSQKQVLCMLSPAMWEHARRPCQHGHCVEDLAQVHES